MDLGSIISEIGQDSKTNTLSCHIYMELKMIDFIEIEERTTVMRN